MSNTIDCSMTSHPSCLPPEDAEEPAAVPTEPPVRAGQPPKTGGTPLLASYDCINDCASSLGAVSLVSSAIAGLGCYALPPACPALIVAVPAAILDACNSACRELESK
jgi:hypothetical protein